jgi:hypothetical protein
MVIADATQRAAEITRLRAHWYRRHEGTHSRLAAVVTSGGRGFDLYDAAEIGVQFKAGA